MCSSCSRGLDKEGAMLPAVQGTHAGSGKSY